jgi:hypothetical protein
MGCSWVCCAWWVPRQIWLLVGQPNLSILPLGQDICFSKISFPSEQWVGQIGGHVYITKQIGGNVMCMHFHHEDDSKCWMVGWKLTWKNIMGFIIYAFVQLCIATSTCQPFPSCPTICFWLFPIWHVHMLLSITCLLCERHYHGWRLASCDSKGTSQPSIC